MKWLNTGLKRLFLGLFFLASCMLSTHAFAALGDSCATGSNLPGTITDITTVPPTCTATSSASTGQSCGGTSYYNSTAGVCVANGASCTGSGTYSGGVCIPPAPATPPSPPSPGGSLGTAAGGVSVGAAPSGAQQPMCVNASPFIGGGVFVVSGTVLCYTGAGQNMNINAYSSSNGWDSLSLQNVYAQGNVTALGALGVYGGAVIVSPDGNTGMVIGNGSALLASQSGSNAASVQVTPTAVTSSVTNGTSTSSVNVAAGSVVVASANATNVASVSTSATTGVSVASTLNTGTTAAVTINGAVGGSNTSSTGVLITGNGNVGTGVVVNGVANWADVAIESKNYGVGAAQGLGTAIIVNDYGIQILSPPLTSAGNSTSTNSFGSGVGNTSDTTVNNNIGLGGAGTVNNNFGSGGGATTSVVTNTIGLAGVQGSTTTTNIGTGTGTGTGATGGATVTNIGNANSGTAINTTAGISTFDMSNGLISMAAGSPLATNGTTGTTSALNSGGLAIYNAAQTIAANTTVANALAGLQYQNKINGNLFVDGNVYINGTLDYVASQSATTSVVGTSVGTSILVNATQATSGQSGIVMTGSTTTYASVDANGKITMATGVADQSSASMTLTNGYGNTHGLIVTETQTTLSGGVHSSSMTLNDNGATFSNADTGTAIQLHGVADGTGDYDAVNVRQLGSGVAMASALAGMPPLASGKEFSMALGTGTYLGQSAMAVGVEYRLNREATMRAGYSSASLGSPVFNAGLAWSW